MKKMYRRHKFLYFDDVAKKWTTQCQAIGDDEAFDEVDFLADQHIEMNVTRESEKNLLLLILILILLPIWT